MIRSGDSDIRTDTDWKLILKDVPCSPCRALVKQEYADHFCELLKAIRKHRTDGTTHDMLVHAMAIRRQTYLDHVATRSGHKGGTPRPMESYTEEEMPVLRVFYTLPYEAFFSIMEGACPDLLDLNYDVIHQTPLSVKERIQHWIDIKMKTIPGH